MPGFDGTGPRGEGPMTGGARGYCNPGYAGYGPAYGRDYGPGWGRGYRGSFGGPRMGRGRGYGRQGTFGRGYGPAYGPAYAGPYGMSREDEINMLKEQADIMKADLDAINRRMEDLESQSPES
jgi:hypothetical protein